METPRFIPQVETALREAGWYPGRTVSTERMLEWAVLDWPTPTGFFQTRLFRAAWLILNEFGDVHVKQNSPGITCYREEFVFNPLLCQGWDLWMEDELPIATAEWEANSILYPLGYYSHPDSPIAVNMEGQIVDGDEGIFLLGDNIDSAISNFIMGIAAQPLGTASEQSADGGWGMVKFSQTAAIRMENVGLIIERCGSNLINGGCQTFYLRTPKEPYLSRQYICGCSSYRIHVKFNPYPSTRRTLRSDVCLTSRYEHAGVRF